MKLKIKEIRLLDHNRGFIHQCPRKKTFSSRSSVSSSALCRLSQYRQRYKAAHHHGCTSLGSINARINVTGRTGIADTAYGRPRGWDHVLITVHCKAQDITNGGHTLDQLDTMSLTGRLARILIVMVLFFVTWACVCLLVMKALGGSEDNIEFMIVRPSTRCLSIYLQFHNLCDCSCCTDKSHSCLVVVLSYIFMI